MMFNVYIVFVPKNPPASIKLRLCENKKRGPLLAPLSCCSHTCPDASQMTAQPYVCVTGCPTFVFLGATSPEWAAAESEPRAIGFFFVSFSFFFLDLQLSDLHAWPTVVQSLEVTKYLYFALVFLISDIFLIWT